MKTNTLLKNIKNQSKKAGLYFALVLTGALNAQVTYTFTNAGATGTAGPTQTQINSAYALTNLNGQVVSTAGIQTWTVPTTASYSILIAGAGAEGGSGRIVSLNYALTAGQVLKILVGQMGTTTQPGTGSGGGGGSFVCFNNNTIIGIAGGAGGFQNATTADPASNGTSGGGVGGSNGNGGTGGTNGPGGAGAGYSGNGALGSVNTIAFSFLNGGLGGQGGGGFNGCDGGFGGGGGAFLNNLAGIYLRSGAGGGYSGGGGSTYGGTAFSNGGGAGSPTLSPSGTSLNYNVGLNAGQGYVIVTLLCSPAAAPTQTTSTQSICNNNTASLNVVNTSTINWYATLTSTTSLATGASFVTPTLSTGTYTYYAAATNTCAQGPRTAITVTVNPNPTVTVNNATVCAGQSYTMVPSGASTYSYSNGSAVATPTANANYTVTGTSTLGCSSTAISSAFVNAAPSVSVNSGAICVGSSFTMVPSGASSYSYSNGGAVATPTANASYTVTGTNTLGCTGTAISTVTVNAIPTVSASSSISGSICAGQSVSLTASGATTYSWNTGATTAVIAVSPSVTTTYTINGSSNGCSNVATITQNVNSCVGIQTNVTKQLAISVYPNPSNGNFTVELANGLTKVINVTDITGRIVLTTSSTSDKVNVNISTLSNGIYYIKVTSDNKAEVTKVVKH